MKLENVELPIGWHFEVNHYGTVLIAPAGGGYCTISFERRCFALGMTVPWPGYESKTYKGRAWKQKLVFDAMAKLLNAMAGRL